MSRRMRFRPSFLVFACLQVLAMGLPLMLASVLFAQQPEATASPASTAPHDARRRVTLQDRVMVLARDLNLDQAQQDAVLRILQAGHEQTLRIRSNTSISGSARIEQFRLLQDNTVLQIRDVLNEDQKKKYDPLAVRKREPAEAQKTVEDWLELTTPR